MQTSGLGRRQEHLDDAHLDRGAIEAVACNELGSVCSLGGDPPDFGRHVRYCIFSNDVHVIVRSRDVVRYRDIRWHSA